MIGLKHNLYYGILLSTLDWKLVFFKIDWEFLIWFSFNNNV